MTSFSVKERASTIERLSHTEYDLVIVGGGITGAGVARDAASRGMSVALLEQADFSSGTSSRSSKLIHGGIRYLENLEFGLVFEALSERTLLFDLAPHLVHPLRFVLPVYKDSRVGMFKMGLGMWLYDLLAAFNAPQMHERLNKEETLERLKLLNTDGLVGSYVYSDAYMDDDLLTVETLRNAYAQGADLVSYIKVTKAEFNSHGKVKSLKAICQETGAGVRVKGKHFVSAVGPWTDIFGKEVLEDWRDRLRPTKGIHFTLHKDRLPLDEAVVMVDDAKNRIVFGIPRHEMIIIGTTDTDYEDNPAHVTSDRDDVDYLLQMCEEYFPGAKVTEEDILASYSGVRPLVKDDSSSEGKTSREHKIWNDPRGITFVAGGKYTTYRHMAEEIVDKALDNFTLEERARFAYPKTMEPLNNKATRFTLFQAEQMIPQWEKETGIASLELERLVGRYGMEVEWFIQRYKEGGSEILELEVEYAIKNTMCFHLSDFYLRRTHLFLAHKDNGHHLLDRVSHRMADLLGWSETQRKEEIARLEQHEKSEMSWKTT